ncbi:MAG: bifunctional 5,10-methylenetetrahydrofolate dehydrogenase/5,10-methenyltetrahydrofolate cyclohydrolase [Deltaproteobacteria bacterium]|nr:bifunctional 5,10-methylenetetrahydrofolate dehydrogenase/5,10-methenyltetrahydrofolate cyclohydrolase [Deltaproteobacteria bacterium]
MQILSGKEVGDALEKRLTGAVTWLKARKAEPSLAVILVGENPESQSYVKSKLATAEKLGMHTRDHFLPATTPQNELEALVARLNADPAVNGILCQLPLPAHLNEGRITQLIDPAKDVDCFHPYNFGLLAQGAPRFSPCTPAGIMEMLSYYKIPVAGQHAVVVGRSNIVGRPMSLLLSQKGADATVTLCHSRTPNLEGYTRQADILVVGIGRPEWVHGDMVRPGAIVIDVGINRVEDASRPRGYRLTGDVDYAAVSPLASAITPVPGGVGPMTVRMLMRNTVLAAAQQHRLALPESFGL